MERFRPEKTKTEYAADRAQITTLQRVPLNRIPEPLRKFHWPIELQGKGEVRESDKTFIIKYPKGDMLLSYATLIHELGHPLQHERNPALQKGTRTHANLLAEERDAWERGWSRFRQANPELIERLEIATSAFHAKAASAPKSFREMYDWIRANTLKMVEVQRLLFEGSSKSEGAGSDALAAELERVGINDFLEAYSQLRTHEPIDDMEAQAAIQRTLAVIVKEIQ